MQHQSTGNAGQGTGKVWLRIVPFLFLAAALLGGCATGPTYSQTKSSISPVGPDQGRIVIYRPVGFVGSANHPTLALNGKLIGQSITGGFFSVDRPPGNYDLVKLGKWGDTDATLSFTLQGGQEMYAKLSVGLAGFSLDAVQPAIASKEIQNLSQAGAFDEATAQSAAYAQEAARAKSDFELRRPGGNAVVEVVAGTNPSTEAASDKLPSPPEKFEDLLVAKESSIKAARQRNRDLVAAKNLMLPKLLRERKTPELIELTSKIEQVILDMNHESEMENDRSQRAVESGTGSVDQHREYSIAYRERMELLKPVLAAVKEEIVNRSK